ncbi:MAG: hypothetical protein J6N68_07485 [Shewanella sp.]|nr:hypothetical protein [Shewanella sp.]
MTSVANWSYTTTATVWKKGAADEYGQYEYGSPLVIACDYGLLGKTVFDEKGVEFVEKNTFWTEYANAVPGDFILLGTHTGLDPLEVGADEVRSVLNYGNTLNRAEAPDFAIVTGV